MRYSAPVAPALGMSIHPPVVAGSTTMWAPNARRVGVVVRQLTAGDTDGDGLVASLPQPEAVTINATSSNAM
jgi:hypothetical protein